MIFLKIIKNKIFKKGTKEEIMKNFKQLVILFFLISILCCGFTKSKFNQNLDKLINNSNIEKQSLISVSIRNANNGKIIYERYADKLLHPASTLKAFSTAVALNSLGKDYIVSTKIYKDKNSKNIFIKLSGDPMLTSWNLKSLFKEFSHKYGQNIDGNIIIDSFKIDDVPWGTGWMWDDENNKFMPKFNAYNLDKNLINIKVIPTTPGNTPKVKISNFYPVKIVNDAITSMTHNITVQRKTWIDTDTIFIEGAINKNISVMRPVGTPYNYFIYRLKQALKENKIKFNGKVIENKLPKDVELICSHNKKLTDEISYTNKISYNLGAEILFKLAAAEAFNKTGNTNNAIKLFKEFYNNIGANTKNIAIFDASGVSHNDLLTTNWMTGALFKLQKTKDFKTYKMSLASPTDTSSTIKNRYPYLKGKLFVKTGTLAGISGITGYITTNIKNKYAFAVLIQNCKGNCSKAKLLEDKIIKCIFSNG